MKPSSLNITISILVGTKLSCRQRSWHLIHVVLWTHQDPWVILWGTQSHSAVNFSSWHLRDPRCETDNTRSSEVQRLAQVVRDMDGQFSSGVHCSSGETEVSVSSVFPPGQEGKLTPALSRQTSHLLVNLRPSSKVKPTSPGINEVNDEWPLTELWCKC